MKFLRIRYEARRHFTLGVRPAAGPLHPRTPAPLDPRSSTLTLLGRWYSAGKLVTCALVSKLTVTFMCLKSRVISNVHYLRGKCGLNTRALISFLGSRIQHLLKKQIGTRIQKPATLPLPRPSASPRPSVPSKGTPSGFLQHSLRQLRLILNSAVIWWVLFDV